MRLAHLADLHLGFRQYHRQTPTGINQREADVANAFRAAIEGVIEARPEVVLMAGDLFHTVRPTNAAIVHAFRQLQRLREALPETRIVMVAGNHDTPRSVETGSILRLFAELGVLVVTDESQRLEFPEKDLSILAVPHQAIEAGERPQFRREGSARYQVLLVHGEVEGLFPLDRWWVEPGGTLLDPAELARDQWNYVALGHYHVMREVRAQPPMWYSGAIEYVTPNPWGELIEQRKSGIRGKGWLLVDLETGAVTPQWIAPARRVVDLPVIEARDRTPTEIDELIAQRLGKVPGGLADQIVRLVVNDVPRHVVRELAHSRIREAKAKALHQHIDFRRPESVRTVGAGAPGHRRTLSELLREHLSRRPLPERVDRRRFVETGVQLLESAQLDRETD